MLIALSFLLALSLTDSVAFKICSPMYLMEESNHRDFANTYMGIIKGPTILLCCHDPGGTNKPSWPHKPLLEPPPTTLLMARSPFKLKPDPLSSVGRAPIPRFVFSPLSRKDFAPLVLLVFGLVSFCSCLGSLVGPWT